MKDKLPKQKIRAPKVPEVQNDPPRVPARMEGKVRNAGIKAIRKPKRT